MRNLCSLLVLVLISIHPLESAAAQSSSGGDYPAAARFVRDKAVLEEQCINGAAQVLHAGGWEVRKPLVNDGSLDAELDDKKLAVRIDCRDNVVLVAGIENHGTARDTALGGVVAALSSRLTGAIDQQANRFLLRQPIGAPFSAWSTKPPRQKIVFETAVLDAVAARCSEAAHLGLEMSNLRPKGLLVENGKVRAAVQCFDNPAQAIIMGVGAFDGVMNLGPQQAALVVSQMTRAVKLGEVALDPPPKGQVRIGRTQLNVDACVSRAAAELRTKGYAPATFNHGIGASRGASSVAIYCLADGMAAVAEAGTSDGSTIAADSLFADAGAPVLPIKPAQVRSALGQSAAIVISSALSAGDCDKIARQALKRAGYPPTAQGKRSEYYGTGQYFCGDGWAGFVVYVQPIEDVQPNAKLSIISGTWANELATPHWAMFAIEPAAPGREPARAEFPFEPMHRSMPAATGQRELYSATYRGVTFTAWSQPVQAGLAPEGQLDAVVAGLAAEGQIVETTRRTDYVTDPGIAVWARYRITDGAVRRSVARYILHDDKIYATEVAYPEGTNVDDDLAHFADTLAFHYAK